MSMPRSQSAQDFASLAANDAKRNQLPMYNKLPTFPGNSQPRRGASNRLMMFIVVVVCFLWYANYGYRLLRKHEETSTSEELLVLDPSFHQPVGANSIEKVHQLGLPHVGINLFVVRRLHGPSSQLQLLLLKRSRQSVTCPSTWSLLGEHSAPRENAAATAARGLREELGVFSDDDTMLMIATCLLDEEYENKRRSVGKHRVDKQLTHVAFYEQDTRQVIDFDEEEISAIKWVTPSQLYEMTMAQATSKDFCSESNAQLVRLGLLRMCNDPRLQAIGQCNLPEDAVATDEQHVCDAFDESYAVKPQTE
eukprot:m.197791 g.197791  ORF g.197791 m.197791 type:complete len:308 (-) comp17026_c0_seq4:3622-4545(-)